MTTMQELVTERMIELDLSYRGAAARSGGLVSHATLNQIRLGRHAGHFDDQTLRGLAKALRVPLATVREAAGLTAQEPAEFRLPRKADQLSTLQRRAVLAMIDAFLEPR